MAWTGLSAGELLQAMRGLSPVSAGAVEELAALRSALLADAGALALVTSTRPPGEMLAELQARTDAVGAAARAYVDVVGLRVLGGYDVADRHAREHPDLIVNIIRSAVTADETTRRAAAEQGLARIRERVPAAHREQFEDLLREAQHTYRIRDERVFHGDAMAAGIARRAILAAGARLTARGQADDPEDLVDATPAEIASLLEGTGGPSRAELTARARWRRETPMTAAPAHLGFPPSPPPPAEWFPPAAARIHRITGLVMSLMFDVHKAAPATPTAPPSKRLKGFAVSAGTYEGPVRVIRHVEELPLVQRGDVLVATSTGPTFNVVLPLIGALVTERGGVLSHAAIVTREYGLPGIVGCVGATTAFTTGTRVRVDGDTGEVWAI
jgi:pyruvate,water dikinase